MPSKSLLQSKTFWFNVASGAVSVASGQMGFTVPPKVAVPVLAIGNILLRLLSSQPVTFTF